MSLLLLLDNPGSSHAPPPIWPFRARRLGHPAAPVVTPPRIWTFRARRLGIAITPPAVPVPRIWPFRVRRLGPPGFVPPAPPGRIGAGAWMLLCGGRVAPPVRLLGTDLGTLCLAAQSAIRAAFTVGENPIAPQAVNLATPDRRPFEGVTVPQILVIPESARPDRDIVAGAGRYVPARVGGITVVFIDKYARDREGTADYLLADSGRGTYTAQLSQLDNILTTEFLADSGGNALTYEPLELASEGVPRPYGRGFEYYGCEWTWTVKWLAGLTVGVGD